VRHFDVARYYGYGEAEEILGDFLRARRSQVTVTTKFGIEPMRRTPGISLALKAARLLVRLLPSMRPAAQRAAQGLVRTGVFTPENAQKSLEASLRALRTDYIDFFLLHDFDPVSHPLPDALPEFLENAVKAGKIRLFGIGTSFENVLLALAHQPGLCDVIQFQNSALTRTMERLPAGGPERLVFTHGALGQGFRSVYSFLNARSEVTRQWSARLDLDVSRGNTLSALMLAYAAEANRRGLVLFSTGDPTRARENAKALLDAPFTSAQLAVFAELVERHLPLIWPR
jgi:D-threo-aldose 1-dehydrogenase